MSELVFRDAKIKSESVSFRINSNIRTTLEDEARRSGIGLNTLVSQIFSRYVSWERLAGRLKLVPVSKDLLREVFQSLQKETIERMARRLAETSAREQIIFMFQQVNLATVLRFVDLWMGHFDAFEHRYDGRKHIFTVHHDVNLNFSIFTKEYLSAIIQSATSRIVQFENVSPNSVTLSFEG